MRNEARLNIAKSLQLSAKSQKKEVYILPALTGEKAMQEI